MNTADQLRNKTDGAKIKKTTENLYDLILELINKLSVNEGKYEISFEDGSICHHDITCNDKVKNQLIQKLNDNGFSVIERTGKKGFFTVTWDK